MEQYAEYAERMAKNIGVDTTTLKGRVDAVLAENKDDWENAGRSEDECRLMALRVAGRVLRTEGDRLQRSGCDLYEGMFLTMPRYKDWAEMAYSKMATTLAAAPDTLIRGLVTQGKIVYYEASGDKWTMNFNPSLVGRQAFVEGHKTTDVGELPNRHRFVDGSQNKAFYLVWDANTPTWPSGDDNFKYGAARPLTELERKALFIGRVQGKEDVQTITITFSGALAQEQFPTYQPGTISLRTGKGGDRAYGKKGVTTFHPNPELASIFTGPPVDINGGEPAGIVPEMATAWLDSLADIPGYVDEHREDDGWWDTWVGVAVEVIHIDPRDRGGFIVSCGDLDIMSLAPSVDLYVPAEQESLVDFGVGSTLMLVGAPWLTREGDGRLSISGWWCIDAIQPAGDGGWSE